MDRRYCRRTSSPPKGTIVDFALSPAAQDYAKRLEDFMDSHVHPAEKVYEQQRRELFAAGEPHVVPAVIEDLKVEAKSRGLWNLFLPDVSGLSNVDYAHLAEIMGRSAGLAPEATNCAAPDTGNMEVLHMFGTAEQKERWLRPLMDGDIRSAFAMTEPAVASSDATNISTEVKRDGDDYVINGRKWWISGAADPRCKFFILMGKTDPTAPTHRQQSQILVPVDTPGVTILRNLPVFGYVDQHGHCEITFENVRVPVTNLIGEEGGGFAIAQARLGPGRIHHCMRAIGVAEKALELMCKRSLSDSFRQDLGRAGRRTTADRRVAHGDRPGPALHALHRVVDRPVRCQGCAVRDRSHQGHRAACVPQRPRPRYPGARRRRRQR
jgi:acyl-CoA dehydrogenase